MKYIRTNTDTYGWIMTQEKRQELIDCARNVYNYTHFDIPIVKQADTIEELCDEFVVMRKHFKTLKNAKKYFKKKENEIIGITLRGAIWTEKGLIYVAKMNNEGKLVCLE